MMSLMVIKLVEFIMGHHVYVVNDQLYIQTDGGPIGLRITGALARLVMSFFDKMFLTKMKKLNMCPYMYSRYVDDADMVTKLLKRMDWNGSKLVPVTQDSDETDVVRTARIVREVADSILPSDMEKVPSKPSAAGVNFFASGKFFA